MIILNNTEKLLKRMISIEKIFTSLIEIEIIKNITLSEEERSFIKYIRKPKIFEMNKFDDNLFKISNLKESDLKNVKNVFNKTEKSEIEERLVQNIKSLILN